jgi:hypothetical protein
MRLKPVVSLLLFYLILGSVVASSTICDFNGSVRLNKSDLLPYLSDQVGCGLQKTSDGSGLLIVAFVIAAILLVIYGLMGRKR